MGVGAKDLIKFSDSIKILYVEDDEKLRIDTTRLLSTFFKDLTVAENGKIALEKYKSEEYDIVISDFVMPEMNGKELTKAIKSINSDQLVIILSAHDEPHYTDELKVAGADGFIFKPLNIQQFMDTLYENCVLIEERRAKNS